MSLTGRLRPFDNDTAKIVPKEPGAYELLYNGTIVYIGSTSVSIQSRIREHRKRKKLAKVTHFRYRVVEWEDDAIELEAKLCKAFKKTNGGRRPRLQDRTPVNRVLFDW